MSFPIPLERKTIHRPGLQPWKPYEPWDRQQGENAIALYVRALGHDPANQFLLFDLARAYAGRGQRDLAQQMLQRVLDLYPGSATVQFKAAQLYRRIDCPICAIKCYRRALELEPQHAQSTEILVEMSILAGHYGTSRRES